MCFTSNLLTPTEVYEGSQLKWINFELNSFKITRRRFRNRIRLLIRLLIGWRSEVTDKTCISDFRPSKIWLQIGWKNHFGPIPVTWDHSSLMKNWPYSFPYILSFYSSLTVWTLTQWHSTILKEIELENTWPSLLYTWKVVKSSSLHCR